MMNIASVTMHSHTTTQFRHESLSKTDYDNALEQSQYGYRYDNSLEQSYDRPHNISNNIRYTISENPLYISFNKLCTSSERSCYAFLEPGSIHNLVMASFINDYVSKNLNNTYHIKCHKLTNGKYKKVGVDIHCPGTELILYDYKGNRYYIESLSDEDGNYAGFKISTGSKSDINNMMRLLYNTRSEYLGYNLQKCIIYDTSKVIKKNKKNTSLSSYICCGKR